MPSPAGRRARPIQPVQIIGDFIVLLVLMYELMILFTRVLGIHDPVSVVVLTLGWLSQAAARLVGARRQAVRTATNATCAMAIAGCAPWCLLVLAHDAYPSAALWQPVAMPAAVRFAGVALALAVMCGRPLWGLRRAPAIAAGSGTVPKPQGDGWLLIGSMLLVSPSPILLGVPLYWLALAIVPDRMWQGIARLTPPTPGESRLLLPASS